MANEISIAASLSCTISGLSVSGSGSKSISIAGTEYLASVQTVGTSAEAVAMADVGTPGYLFVKNNDSTNFVYASLNAAPDASNSFAKLLPGEFLLIPTRQTTIYLKADTSPCSCQIVLTEL